MVLLGGLEIVAAGYLLNELNENRIKEREQKKHRKNSQSSSHSHDRPSSSHHHKPPRPPRPPHSSSLMPPAQHPPRPSSAPPVNGPNHRPQGQWEPAPLPPPSYHMPQQPHGQWQQPQQQHQQQPPPQQQQPYPQPYNHPPPYAPPEMHYPPPMLQHPNTFPTHNQTSGPPPQRPQQHQSQSLPPPQQQQQPPPPQQPPTQPGPADPLKYYNMRTGKWQSHIWPAGHPNARGDVDGGSRGLGVPDGHAYYSSDSEPEDSRYLSSRQTRHDGMAYGKDYSRRSRSSTARY